ncbi:MAG: exopolysaccharide biosynthesis protein, partial [Bacteroidales bacterium]|nr:exopolysaccharide biosynthesis protein [Bacteroidales bacterium]
SPIGSTLKRIERDISFTEQSYLSVLQSLNAALLRQKTLQMTSANLKPINPPLFPVSPLPTKRKLIVLTSYLMSIVFLLAFFVLVEIFDRTLRDRYRTERIIPAKVLGAFPRQHRFRYRSYFNSYIRICTNYLANSIIPFLNPKERPDIINFISTDEGTGKTKLITLLEEYWTERGLKVRAINWSEQEFSESREYLLSNNFYDFNDYDNEDIIIIEHRSLMKSAIPVGLLREASLNLLTVRADKVWRDIDKIAFDRLKLQVQSTPLMLYLTETTRDVAESFVGQLPPVSRVRSFIYKLLQLGFTSK